MNKPTHMTDEQIDAEIDRWEEQGFQFKFTVVTPTYDPQCDDPDAITFCPSCDSSDMFHAMWERDEISMVLNRCQSCGFSWTHD